MSAGFSGVALASDTTACSAGVTAALSATEDAAGVYTVVADEGDTASELASNSISPTLSVADATGATSVTARKEIFGDVANTLSRTTSDFVVTCLSSLVKTADASCVVATCSESVVMFAN